MWLGRGADTLIAQAKKVPGSSSSGDRGRRRIRPAPTAPAAPAVGAPAAAERRARKEEKAVTELYRVYEIDSLTWWNFDYPQPSLTCLKGTLVGAAGDHASVTVFSRKPLGAYTLYQGKEFRISFYRNANARLFAIDEKGNIGRTGLFETPDFKGHHKDINRPCEDIGKVKLAPV